VERRVATERTSGLTYQDLERMFPQEELVRRELIDGELFVTPSPSTRHQRSVAVLVHALRSFANRTGGEALPGPLDVLISDTTVLEPDVLYVRPERLPILRERFLDGPPDLVVEVSSPSTRRLDLTRKKEIYAAFGVPEYWFVDLDADRVEVYRLEAGRYGAPTMVGRSEAIESPNLPALSVPVEDVLGPTS
jgi:Uma2 family endonuclease